MTLSTHTHSINLIHTLSTPPCYLLCYYTTTALLEEAEIIHYPHVLSTHPINPPYQPIHTLSTTPYQPYLVIYFVITPRQPC